MSLLDKNLPRGKTAQASAQLFRKFAQKRFKYLVRTYDDALEWFWNHPEVTPHEIVEALGPDDTAELFRMIEACRQAILTMKSDQELKTAADFGWTYSVNDTGITIEQA